MCLHFNILQIKYIAACLKNVKWKISFDLLENIFNLHLIVQRNI